MAWTFNDVPCIFLRYANLRQICIETFLRTGMLDVSGYGTLPVQIVVAGASTECRISSTKRGASNNAIVNTWRRGTPAVRGAAFLFSQHETSQPRRGILQTQALGVSVFGHPDERATLRSRGHSDGWKRTFGRRAQPPRPVGDPTVMVEDPKSLVSHLNIAGNAIIY